MDVDVDKEGFAKAILSKCHQILTNLTKKNDPQLMFIRSEPANLHGTDTDMHSIYSISGVDEGTDGIRTLFTGKELDNSLSGISFRNPKIYQQNGMSCPLSQFSIPHGVVKNKKEFPFVLPGYQVEIQCDPGYGVKLLNYTSTQTLVCSEDAKPRLCVRIKSIRVTVNKNKDEGFNDLCNLFLFLVIVSLVIAVVLLVILLKRSRQRTEVKDLEKADNTLPNPSMTLD